MGSIFRKSRISSFSPKEPYYNIDHRPEFSDEFSNPSRSLREEKRVSSSCIRVTGLGDFCLFGQLLEPLALYLRSFWVTFVDLADIFCLTWATFEVFDAFFLDKKQEVNRTVVLPLIRSVRF